MIKAVEKFWCCSPLPLAVYREIVAQLEQVSGVMAVKIQLYSESATFDYGKSQVEGLALTFDANSSTQAQIGAILAHYERS